MTVRAQGISPGQIHVLTDRSNRPRFSETRVQQFLDDPDIYDRGTFVDLDPEPTNDVYEGLGLKVVGHMKMGIVRVDTLDIKLVHSTMQQQGHEVFCGALCAEVVRTYSMFNATLLEFYLSHQKCIPLHWIHFKSKDEAEPIQPIILFPGTEYRRIHDGPDLWLRAFSVGVDGELIEIHPIPQWKKLSPQYFVAVRSKKK